MKKLTITIGVCAYNEEKNIGKLLSALTKQTEKTIRIGEILVYSDGSTDKTVEVARSVPDKRIRVIDDSLNRGKAVRLNTLFKEAIGTVIVLFDADYIPTAADTAEQISRPFQNPSFTGLAGGRRKAIPSQTLTGIGLANVFESFDIVRSALNNGKNLYSFLAGITALHRDFARTLTLPLDSPCDDNHIYLEAKKRGLPLAYIPSAIVWFSPPQTATDQIAQGGRYLASIDILSRYFERNYVEREFFVPFSLRIRVFLYQIIRNPVAYLWIKYLSLICLVQNRRLHNKQGGMWSMIPTTKKIV